MALTHQHVDVANSGATSWSAREGVTTTSEWGAPNDVPVALVLLDADNNVADFNEAAATLLGGHGLLRSGMPFLAFVGPAMRNYLRWRNSDDDESLKTSLRTGSRLIPVEMWQSKVAGSEGNVVISIVSAGRSHLSKAQGLAFEEAQVGMFVTGSGGDVLAANPALLELTRLGRDDVVGMNWQQLFFASLPPAFVSEVNAELRENDRWRGRVVSNVAERGDRIFDLTLRVRELDANEPEEQCENSVVRAVVASVTDVTDGSSVEQALKQQARHDQLTGLLNRAGFLEELELRFDRAQRAGTGLSLMYLDLDHFKSLNDHFGHRYGDILLEAFAKRLRSSLKSTDVIGRVGGDEFTVLFDPALSPVTLDNVAHKLKGTLLQDYQLDELNYTCTASFGSAGYPWDASTADELLEYADHAMYQAKTLGRNKHTRFDRKEFRNWVDREEMIKSIEDGIGDMQFVPYYQPIFDAETRRLRGAEALVRWVHPDSPDDPRLPAEFLSLVDGSPAGVHMGTRMLDQVVVHMRSFAETTQPVSISVNLSAAQLRSEDVVAHVERLARSFPEQMKQLRVEMVESAFYDGDPIIAENLARISGVGVTLALDDFGTGHSSMLSLRAHDFTELKIDREFLWAASSRSHEDVVVFESMIELSRKLGMHTVCEGVETEEQLRYVQDLGCNSVQGFLLGRPMPKDAFRLLLATTERAPELA